MSVPRSVLFKTRSHYPSRQLRHKPDRITRLKLMIIFNQPSERCDRIN
ncbi:MAG: hypothetical protein KME25_03930 [Symplocastrum torsivum CPER-KK1]|uniref:Uncharacterized protein n=1 Tax=Symplocastrum torsivum CPER-KK1 TaxID=450513 RepID=A0A951PHC9_9CYAN|nr:hypothetical protein [Symplocastrum torsivum CPER-KK1]